MKVPELDFRDPQLKNMIINGSFRFWQRSVSINPIANNSNTYLADRFGVYENHTTGAVRVDRDTDVPDNSVLYSLKVETTTAGSPLAGESSGIRYVVEGQDLIPIRGKPFTLCFWVKSSITGTFNLALRNGASDRNLVKKYTINAANTWQLVKMKLTHDSSGTWDYGSGFGMNIQWALSAGTDLDDGVDGVWGSTTELATADGQTNLLGTIGNSFRLAKVWMYPGWNDLEFEGIQPSFQEEIKRCERYYESSYNIDTQRSTVTVTGAWHSRVYNTDQRESIPFKTIKRIVPVVSVYNPVTGGTGTWRNFSSGANVSIGTGGVGGEATTGTRSWLAQFATGNGERLGGHWDAEAEF